MIGLEERGFVRRLPHRARALEVLRLLENVGGQMRSMSRRASEGFAPNVIKGDFRLPGHPVTPDRSQPLPLYGKIAAGMPIAALRDHPGPLKFPRSCSAEVITMPSR